MTETAGVFGQALPALIVFVGAPLLIWWLRRRRPAAAGSLRVIARTALTRNSVVAVVETGSKRFLLGATDQGISVLSELEDEPDSHGNPTTDTMNRLPDAAAPFGPWTSPLEHLRAMTVRRAPRPRPTDAHRR